jgi:hypothetical protein
MTSRTEGTEVELFSHALTSIDTFAGGGVWRILYFQAIMLWYCCPNRESFYSDTVGIHAVYPKFSEFKRSAALVHD